jgi:hypothetical protein
VLQSDPPATFPNSMRRRLLTILAFAAAAVALFAGVQAGSAAAPIRAPKGFFGIDPQSVPTERDVSYMKAGGIETVRWPMAWSTAQPTPRTFDWDEFDEVVAVAAKQGLKVLPFVYSTPAWVALKPTTLPVLNGRARRAWAGFLQAAVERYGPGGEFWAERRPRVVGAPGGLPYEPALPPRPAPIVTPVPIRSWQVWNEANFFYFAKPASPQRYTKLLKLSSPAIKAVDPGAKVILGGLFAEPTARGSNGMTAVKFLDTVYRSPGIKRLFDGIALHPYAVDAETLEEFVEELHDVTLENHDRVPLYVTEMGWGSQDNFEEVAFEQGIRGQVKQLRDSYAYLLQNRNRLNLKQVYWFSWKDFRPACNFCDSVGLFRQGAKFRAKPAWHTFLSFTHGRARP